MPGLLPDRSAEDIFAGRVHLTFGGVEYALQTPPIEQEEAWLQGLEGTFRNMLAAMGSGDDTTALLQLLGGSTPQMLDALYSYDVDHVLPPREELRRTARTNELIVAVLEVWVAANPLVGIALIGMRNPTQLASLVPTSTSPDPTDGTPEVSELISAESSSSRTSMPHKNGARTNGRRKSKR